MLPEEIERMIWESYKIRYIHRELKNKPTIWKNPSKNLLKMTKETGAIQIRCTDFERILAHGHMKWYYENLHYQPCLLRLCIDCVRSGFPCSKAVHIGHMDNNMLNHWMI